MLAVALFALGLFAAIYHPVGTAIVVSEAINRGRTLAFNGVCGNLGVAFAAGITAALTAWFGWRSAFLIPAAICIGTGIAYLMLVPGDRQQAANRSSVPDVRLADVADDLGVRAVRADRRHCRPGLQYGDDRAAEGDRRADRRDVSLVAVGGMATIVFLAGAVAQFTVGRVLEKYPPHLVFAAVGLLQFVGVVWAVYATGYMLLAALAFAMAFIYAQVTVNDFVIARYTADAWRGRVYAVRYFITYLISGAASSMIAFLHGRGGFDLVLGVTAVVALGFVIGTALLRCWSTASNGTQGRAAGRIDQNSCGARSMTCAPVRSCRISAILLRWQWPDRARSRADRRLAGFHERQVRPLLRSPPASSGASHRCATSPPSCRLCAAWRPSSGVPSFCRCR